LIKSKSRKIGKKVKHPQRNKRSKVHGSIDIPSQYGTLTAWGERLTIMGKTGRGKRRVQKTVSHRP